MGAKPRNYQMDEDYLQKSSTKAQIAEGASKALQMSKISNNTTSWKLLRF
jgi:hypothetical protein